MNHHANGGRRSKDVATIGRRMPALPRGERHAGIFVVARTHGAFGENIVLGDPLEGFVEDVLCVGFEDEALARAPAAGVHPFVEADRKFIFWSSSAFARASIPTSCWP